MNALVSDYRAQGLQRRNLAGQTVITTPGTPTGVATVYKDCPYAGAAVGLKEGDYTTAQLRALGMENDAISSLKVNSGYEVQLFMDDNFTGAAVVRSGEISCFDGTWNDKVSSLKVRKGSSSNSSSLLIQAEAYSSMGGVRVENTSDTDGSQNVGYIDATDWMSYRNINFPASGAYLIEYRVASLGGSTLAADLNAGAIQLGSVPIPATGGWQSWRTVSHTVNVNAGTYDFGIYAPQGGWNLNWIRITKANASRLAGPATAAASGPTPALTLYPNPAGSLLTLQAAEAFVGGEVRIRDAVGRQVWSAPYQGQAVPVAELKAGQYLLELSNAGTTSHLHFIKQ